MVVNNVGIDKLRVCKRKLYKLNKIITSYVDSESESFVDSDTLKEMLLIIEIDEIITEVIHYIIDNQKTEKS